MRRTAHPCKERKDGATSASQVTEGWASPLSSLVPWYECLSAKKNTASIDTVLKLLQFSFARRQSQPALQRLWCGLTSGQNVLWHRGLGDKSLTESPLARCTV